MGRGFTEIDANAPQEAESSSPRRRWLCIAHAFPPIHRSGTQRTLGFVKNLHALGWDAVVLTARVGYEPVDYELLREVPASTRVIRTNSPDLLRGLSGWRGVFFPKREHPKNNDRDQNCDHKGADLKDVDDSTISRLPARSPKRARFRAKLAHIVDWCSWWLHTPDSKIGWVIPSVIAGLRAMRRECCEIIYSTSPCMSAHLIALLVSRIARKPWVADFRDPWRGNPFRKLPYDSINRWDAWLEKMVLRFADHVLATTPTTTELLNVRCGSRTPKCRTILNGFDADKLARIAPQRIHAESEFVFAHAGEFYGQRTPFALFEALRGANENGSTFDDDSSSSPISSETTLATGSELHQPSDVPDRRSPRLLLIGSEQFGGKPLIDIAREIGVEGRVTIVGRKCHAETLALVAGSDAAVAIGSSGAGGSLQIPAKLYEYIGLNKPILAIFEKDNPVSDILANSAFPHSIAEPDDTASIARGMTELMELVSQWRIRANPVSAANSTTLTPKLIHSPFDRPCFVAGNNESVDTDIVISVPSRLVHEAHSLGKNGELDRRRGAETLASIFEKLAEPFRRYPLRTTDSRTSVIREITQDRRGIVAHPSSTPTDLQNPCST